MSNKTGIICCDLMSVPDGTTIEELFHIMNKTNMLFYDSFKGGNKPHVINGTTDRFVVDLNTADNRKLFDKFLNKINNEEND